MIVSWCRMASRRLRSNKQFRLVYSEGRKEAGKKVIIYYLMRHDEEGIIPGFVASRRIGKACQRNRAKRLMREIFRRLQKRIAARRLWIVFIASFDPRENTFQEILEDVEGSLARAGILSANG
jgi:ribonuclease P protein component